jgi:pSer/pThr/pTyr-binding forkhead associated (FHA) protein/F0F1-type ATP synthase membrane subunit b/b'
MADAQKIALVKTLQGMEASLQVVDQERFTFGRSLEATIMVTDPSVSRLHLEVVIKKGRVFVTDMGSANGSFLNGKRIDAKKPYALSPGDVFQLGTWKANLYVDLIEKIFNAKEAKLDTSEQERIEQIIENAKAAAERTAKFAQDVANQTKLDAEKKSKTLTEEAELKATEMLRQARSEVDAILSEVKRKETEVRIQMEKEANGAVSHIHKRAYEIERQAEDKSKFLESEARKTADELVSRAQKDAETLISQAKSTGSEIRQAAEASAERVKQEGAQKAKDLIQNADLDLKRIKDAAEDEANQIIEKASQQLTIAKADAQYRANEITKDAQAQADKLLMSTRLDAERIKEKIIEDGKLTASEAIRKSQVEADTWLSRVAEYRRDAETAQKTAAEIIGKAQNDADIVRRQVEELKLEAQALLDRTKAEADKKYQELVEQAFQEIAKKRKDADGELEFLREKTKEEARLEAFKTLSTVKGETEVWEQKRVHAEREYQQIYTKMNDVVARTQKEADTLRSQAEAYKAEAHEALEKSRISGQEKFTKMIEEARAESDKIIAQARQDAEKQKHDIITETRLKAEDLIRQAQKDSILAVENTENQKRILEKELSNLEIKTEEIRREALNKGFEIERAAEEKARQITKSAEMQYGEITEKARLDAKKFLDEQKIIGTKTLQEFRDQATKVIEDARNQGEIIKADAKSQSQIIINDAKAESEKILIDCRLQVEKLNQEAAHKAADATNAVATAESQMHEIRREIQALQIERDSNYQRTTKARDEAAQIEADVQAAHKKQASVLGDLQQVENKLSHALSELEKSVSGKDAAELANTKAQAAMVDAENKKQAIIIEIKKLKEEAARQKGSLEKELGEFSTKAQAELEEYRRKETEAIQQARIRENEKLKAFRDQAIDELKAKRKHFSSEISRQLEIHMLPFFKSQNSATIDWTQVQSKMTQVVSSVVEEETYKATGSYEQVISLDLEKKQNDTKVKLKKLAMYGVPAAIAILMSFPGIRSNLYDIVSGLNDKGETAVEAAARKKRELRALKKYNPPKTDEFKSSYTDNVLYTNQYTEIKLDPKTQEEWIKASVAYMHEVLKVDEDSVVKAVSAETTMISLLEEKRQEIDLDYLEKDIQKMRDLESETVDEVRSYLGGELNYKKYKELSAKFYRNTLEDRGPASEEIINEPSQVPDPKNETN